MNPNNKPSFYNGDSSQELFVIDVLEQKKHGYYVELGAFNSKLGSNTYHLEKDYLWEGVSFEVVDERR
jgi:hypothetical protein